MNKTVFAGVLLSLAYAGAANATLVATISPTGAPAGQTYVNLNNLATGNGGGTATGNVTISFTGSNAAIVNGSSPNNYAAPVFSNGNGTAFGDANGVDTSNYIAVGVGGAATISMPSASQFFGLLWGTVDSYNALTFYSGANGTGTNLGVLTSANLPSTSNGSPTALSTVYVNVNSTQAFRSVVVTSSVNAFELDNLAFGSAQVVPEPVSLALLGTSLVGMGMVRRRRAK